MTSANTAVAQTPNNQYKRYICELCGLIYDEARGWPEEGIAAGTRWQDVADTWVCPDCGASKSDFAMVALDD